MRKHLITRVVAGVATLAFAGSLALASPASAEPNSGGTPAKKGCVDPDGGTADLPHGTVHTSTDQSGHVAGVWKCNDGTWERQPDTIVRRRASRVTAVRTAVAAH